MAQTIELHPQAEVEFWETVDWYDASKTGLGKEFARVFEQMVEAISKKPRQFPIVFGRKRQAKMSRFPYSIFFGEKPNFILIVAVFHHRRNPELWERR